MSNTKQYLDYAGLQTYHNELIQRLVDLEFEPNKMFADVNAFKGILENNSSVTESTTAEEMGWRVIGNKVDFDINDHTLILTK